MLRSENLSRVNLNEEQSRLMEENRRKALERKKRSMVQNEQHNCFAKMEDEREKIRGAGKRAKIS